MAEQIHLGHRVSKAALQILQIPGSCLSLPELADLRLPPVVAPERGETQIWGIHLTGVAQLRGLVWKVRSGRVEPTTRSDDVQLPKLLHLRE